MKSLIINSMVSFTLGTGAALIGLASWTGTSNLNDIKQAVEQYTATADEQVSSLLTEYNIVVDEANAEIGEYKAALEQANNNISQLVTAYETKVQQAEQDLTDLQLELDNLYARMDQQYQDDMNAVIEQANMEINQANTEVELAAQDVTNTLNESEISHFNVYEQLENASQLDTSGDKTVTDISAIVGEVEGE